MQEFWDVLIIGAGPAGGIAAFDCAKKGLSVLLVEQRKFPRWKVCGCCFNNQAQGILNSLKLDQLVIDCEGTPLQSLRLGLQGREATVDLPGGFVLSRERFDQALIDAAVNAGAVAKFQTKAKVEAAQPGCRNVLLKDQCTGTVNHVKAGVVLVAAGLSQHCLSKTDSGKTKIQKHSRHGAGCIADDKDNHYPEGIIHMAIGRRGYVGLVRREDGLLNIAGAFDRNALAHTQGAAGATQEVLMQAGFPVPTTFNPRTRWQLTPALSRRSQVLAGERFLMMGDAAGYVEPFTGEGMAWALTAGAAVSPFVEEGLQNWSVDLESRWEQTVQVQIGRRQRICRSLSLLLRQPLPTKALFEIVKRSPTISAKIVSSLNEVKLPNLKGEQCL